jgi:hypothetical protein
MSRDAPLKRGRIAIKTLYFDVDGTVLPADRPGAKPRLAGGGLEAAVRRAGFVRLVCVGNFARIAHLATAVDPGYDAMHVLFDLCGGAFADEDWFRSVTTLIRDPELRTRQIDYAGDWWYVDDLAEEYFREAGQDGILAAHRGTRVHIPDPVGNGQDMLDWLSASRG